MTTRLIIIIINIIQITVMMQIDLNPSLQENDTNKLRVKFAQQHKY